MIKDISSITVKNVKKEFNDIKKEFKNQRINLEKIYIYYVYKDPEHGMKSNAIKRPLNNKNMKFMIAEIDSLKNRPEIIFLSFGLEYSGDDIIDSARDLLIVTKNF